MHQGDEICVVGMGYVGLTLAVTLADIGYRVWGYERQQELVDTLNSGRSPMFEPGVEDVLRRKIGNGLSFAGVMPQGFRGTVIICVSTPVGADNTPDLTNLAAATEHVAQHIEDDAMVVVRSTVPVGTSRGVVLPILRRAHPNGVLLASCPERTIQGRALEELRRLPQVVGGLDDASTAAAAKLWGRVTEHVVTVSSLEAAEMVKLVNNSHTDVIYSFGNEVAMMAHGLGLDPMEVIAAANLDYPRPDLARPGFVGGPCLTKDPYILIDSSSRAGHAAGVISASRALNESLPAKVAEHFVESLRTVVGDLADAKVLVCGFAYKGHPVTDDTRGAPATQIMEVLLRHGLHPLGHDHLVSGEAIASMGATPVKDLRTGLEGARGVLFVNEHPGYQNLPVQEVAAALESPAVLYDCWRMYSAAEAESVPGVHYRGIGFG